MGIQAAFKQQEELRIVLYLSKSVLFDNLSIEPNYNLSKILFRKKDGIF